jgi:hypothetical protein
MNHAGLAKGPAQSAGDDLDEILDVAEVLRGSRCATCLFDLKTS